MDLQEKNLDIINNKLLNKNINIDYSEDSNNNFDEPILNKTIKRKEKIHSEIYKLINKNMEKIENQLERNNINYDETLKMNSSLSFEKDVFLNYSGEKISIISYINSISQTIENEDKDENNTINNKNKKYENEKKNDDDAYLFHNKKIYKKYNQNYLKRMKLKEIMINNNKGKEFDSSLEREAIINNFNWEKINESSNKKEKNDSKQENGRQINLKKRKKESKIRNIFLFDNNLNSPNNCNLRPKDFHKSKSNNKDKSKCLISSNFSLFDSTSTANTYKKNKYRDDTLNSNIDIKYNKTELINFFSEINLPIIYADKFIENGFDDFDLILNLTKTSIAITNQNLKDIGINCPGHRAKILIHLEEKANIIPLYLEKNIIYNSTNNYLNNSLFKFFNGIGCIKYVNSFRRNGYFNSELLFSQMLTREPITKKMLIEDFGIDNEDNINRIIKGLNEESINYFKKLKKKNKNKNSFLDDKLNLNSCETCNVF